MMQTMGEDHAVEVFADEDAFEALNGHYAGSSATCFRRAFRNRVSVTENVDQNRFRP